MIAFLISAVRTGMTFLFGSTGETLTEKSGNLNLGIPGIMSAGAAFGCAAEYLYGAAVGKTHVNPTLAVLIPILCAFLGGALLGLIYCFLTVTLNANQNVTGLVLTTLGVGLTGYIISKTKSFAFAAKYFTAPLPFAKNMTGIGKLFLSYGVMVWLAIAIALICSWVLSHTRIGLNLRAVGESPETADAAGINVTRYRYVATLIGSGIAGLGGLCYIMDNLFGSWEYTIEAMGWLAIALVIFTIWKPNIGILGSILFGMLYNVSSYIKNITFAQRDLIEMLPYVVTILVLVITSIRNKKENQPPAHLGLPYFREER